MEQTNQEKETQFVMPTQWTYVGQEQSQKQNNEQNSGFFGTGNSNPILMPIIIALGLIGTVVGITLISYNAYQKESNINEQVKFALQEDAAKRYRAVSGCVDRTFADIGRMPQSTTGDVIDPNLANYEQAAQPVRQIRRKVKKSNNAED